MTEQDAPAPEPTDQPAQETKLYKHWADSFVAFDTETTGFSPAARVIEVSVLRFECGQLKTAFNTLLDPGEAVNWTSPETLGALKVNRITREQLIGQPRFEDVFATLMMQFAASPVWVAHNKAYDLRMLKNEREIITRKYNQEYSVMVPKPKAVLDTMLLDVFLDTRPLVSRKLEEVASRWIIKTAAVQQTHRAQEDAEDCGRTLLAMLEQRPELAQMPLRQVIEAHKKAEQAWANMRAQVYARTKGGSAKNRQARYNSPT